MGDITESTTRRSDSASTASDSIDSAATALSPTKRRRSSANRAGTTEASSGAQRGESSKQDQLSAERDVAGQTVVATLSRNQQRTVAQVLASFEVLAGRKDYFTALEDALKANISILVPAVMSMDQFARTIQSLRESNAEMERKTGNTTEDPLAAVREFLNKVEVTQ